MGHANLKCEKRKFTSPFSFYLFFSGVGRNWLVPLLFYFSLTVMGSLYLCQKEEEEEVYIF
jgi:hypothetical protein